MGLPLLLPTLLGCTHGGVPFKLSGAQIGPRHASWGRGPRSAACHARCRQVLPVTRAAAAAVGAASLRFSGLPWMMQPLRGRFASAGALRLWGHTRRGGRAAWALLGSGVELVRVWRSELVFSSPVPAVGAESVHCGAHFRTASSPQPFWLLSEPLECQQPAAIAWRFTSLSPALAPPRGGSLCYSRRWHCTRCLMHGRQTNAPCCHRAKTAR